MLALLIQYRKPIAIGLCLLLVAGLTFRIKSLQSQIVFERAKMAQLAAGLQSANRTVDALNAANEKLADLSRNQRKANARAVEALADTEKRMQESARRLRAREDADRELPDCQKLLDTSLTVCPNISDAIRMRARGL